MLGRRPTSRGQRRRRPRSAWAGPPLSLSDRKKQLSASRTSLHKTQKGITAKGSSSAEKRDSSTGRSTDSSDTKTTAAQEAISDLTSPASNVSVASGRRLPGKSKAASLLSQRRASVAKTSRDAATASKTKPGTERSSPPLSDSGLTSPRFFLKGLLKRLSRGVAEANARSPEPRPRSGDEATNELDEKGSKEAATVGAPRKAETGRSSRRQSAVRSFLPRVYEFLKPQEKKASTAGTRRPSIVTTKQSDKENTARETKADAETTRTEKLQTEVQTDASDSDESQKAVELIGEHFFGSAPGSPQARPSPSARSFADEDKLSKDKSKSSVTSKASAEVPKAASAEGSSASEEELFSKADIEDEPEEEDVLPVAVAVVAVEEPDTESKQDMDEILRELEKQTTVLYPESNLVAVIGILCILWILLLVFLTSPKYGPRPGIWPTSAFTTWPPYHPSTVRPSVGSSDPRVHLLDRFLR
ncbi:hypothetical protein MTO96_025994 [Rhipicephalus appendiculatus]